jgi:putative transposase
VSARVSPTEKIRAQIDALFDGSRELVESIEEVARLGAQLIIQTAVEAEVSEFLGRARYERAAGCETAKAGSRNGYCPTTIKTTAGPVAVSRPKLRGTSEVFASRLFGTGITKSNALESLVIAGFVRGLSVREVEATIADALGAQATVSKSEVSRICQVIRDELDTWSARRLDDVELDYLSWTARTSATTSAPPPSRCSPRGASTPRASRCSSVSARPAASPATPGRTSSPTSASAGWAVRCWSSPTARPA